MGARALCLATLIGSLSALGCAGSKDLRDAATTSANIDAKSESLFNSYRELLAQHSDELQSQFASLNFSKVADRLGGSVSAEIAALAKRADGYGTMADYLQAMGVKPFSITLADLRAGLQLSSQLQQHAEIFANIKAYLPKTSATRATVVARPAAAPTTSSDSSALKAEDTVGSSLSLFSWPSLPSLQQLGSGIMTAIGCAAQYESLQGGVLNIALTVTRCDFWRAIDQCGGSVQSVAGGLATFDADPDTRAGLDAVYYGTWGAQLASPVAQSVLNCAAAATGNTPNQ